MLAQFWDKIRNAMYKPTSSFENKYRSVTILVFHLGLFSSLSLGLGFSVAYAGPAKRPQGLKINLQDFSNRKDTAPAQSPLRTATKKDRDSSLSPKKRAHNMKANNKVFIVTSPGDTQKSQSPITPSALIESTKNSTLKSKPKQDLSESNPNYLETPEVKKERFRRALKNGE